MSRSCSRRSRFPLEVAEPIKSADAPVVVELKRAPIMAIRPTGEEVQLAVAVTPPPVMTAAATEPAHDASGHRQPAADDRDVRNAGPVRRLRAPHGAQDAFSNPFVISRAARLYRRAARRPV